MEDINYSSLFMDLENEEKQLCFTSFSNEDAMKIGNKIIKLYDEFGNAAVEISINGAVKFSFYPSGTSPNNALWIERKRNTVFLREMSSLRFFAFLKMQEKTQEECGMPAEKYAAVGGGFPIRIKGGAVIGSICVSNLPHFQDHQLIVKGIKNYLTTVGIGK